MWNGEFPMREVLYNATPLWVSGGVYVKCLGPRYCLCDTPTEEDGKCLNTNHVVN